MKETLFQLQVALTDFLAQCAEIGALCIAFSGGVDSALLVKMASDAGLHVHAVTFDSTLQPLHEAQAAAMQAASYGAEHLRLQVDPLQTPAVASNCRERCYHCKYALFSALKGYAQTQGLSRILDGTNADDLLEYRPGLRALSELGVISPLAKLGITKAQVRALAEEIGLDVAKKPSSPCLATRFPYDTPLTIEALSRAGAAEAFLREAGFPVVRVRVQGEIARIEVPTEALARLFAQSATVSARLKHLGYSWVTADLSGFQSGSFDRATKTAEH